MSHTEDEQELLAELFSLYNEHRLLLGPRVWEFESDRWRELLAVLLMTKYAVPSDEARAAVELLDSIGLEYPESACEEGQGPFLTTLLGRLKSATISENAAAISQDIVKISRAVKERWSGHIQKFIRPYARTILADLSKELTRAGLSEVDAGAVSCVWLQNVLNVPLLFENHPNVVAFCERRKLSSAELIERLDKLDLNAAVFDDLLEAEAVNRAKAELSATANTSSSMAVPGR